MGWPSIHEDDSTILAPYNDSLFKLRNMYQVIFQEFPNVNTIEIEVEEEDPEDYLLEESSDMETMQVFQISYTLNMLPAVL